MSAPPALEREKPPAVGLVRNLGLLGAVAVSLAVVGPSMSVSLNPQAMAEQVGGAVPVVYVLALVPLATIALAFIVLTRRHGTAGSLYGLVGLELGPKAGAVSGMWLLMAYCTFTAVTASSFGIFTVGFVEAVFDVTISDTATFAVMGAGMLLALVFSIRPARLAGHVLLIMEGVTMTLIMITVAVTFIRLITVGGPQGQTVDFSEFSLSGVTTGAMGLAITFAILSTAGFEGAAAAGEETKNPTRSVPMAILLTAIIVNVFYIVVSGVAVWAFGTSPQEMQAFINSPSLPGDMADTYVSLGLGDFITLGGAVSSLACMIAAQIAGGRIMYAFARDGLLPGRLAVLSRRWSTPVLGSVVTAIIGSIIVALSIIPTAGSPFSVFELVSDYAGVLIVSAYGAACVAAAIVLWRRGGRLRLACLIPSAGVVIVVIVMYFSLFPLPTGWELVAPLAGVTTVVVLTFVGLLVSGRATPRTADA
ncbi:MAG: APC family permease [Candidatus Nanopelagicales bacterium]